MYGAKLREYVGRVYNVQQHTRRWSINAQNAFGAGYWGVERNNYASVPRGWNYQEDNDRWAVIVKYKQCWWLNGVLFVPYYVSAGVLWCNHSTHTVATER